MKKNIEKIRKTKNKGKGKKLSEKPREVHLGIIVQLEILVAMIAFVTLGATIASYFSRQPGMVITDQVEVEMRDTDTIEFSWPETRNTDNYEVYYKKSDSALESWGMIETDENSVKLAGLEEGTEYDIRIYAENEDDKSIKPEGLVLATRKDQEIGITDDITKSVSVSDFPLEATSNTPLKYSSGNEEVASVDAKGNVHINGTGSAVISIEAEETEEYVGASKDVNLLVLDATPASSIKVLYGLNSDNCSVFMAVTGVGGVATVPQGLAYTGDKVIISYGMHDAQRIVSFDIETGEKSISVPKVALGHPNGFTYSPETGLCYCVKGWSGRTVTYNPETDEYGVINFANGLSGVAYDWVTKQFYGSSRTGTSVYDVDYKHVRRFGNVNHSMSVSTQDCGGHDGIFLRCLSPSSNTHGTNYIDMYNTETGEYIGSLECSLSEVESVAVDKDGYLLILANNTSSTDYIWKAPIKIEGLLG